MSVSVKLVGDNRPSNGGRLMAHYVGWWGTVCAYGFENKEVQVACRMLGFR